MKKIIVSLFLCMSWNAHAALEIQSWNLPNGTKIQLVEYHTIPMVDVLVTLDAGSLRDPEGKSGVAKLVAQTLNLGVEASAPINPGGQALPALDEAQLSDAFADIAANYGGGASTDSAAFHLRVLSHRDQLNPAINIFARILNQPAFSDSSLDKEKARMISDIRESDVQPAPIAGHLLLKAMYGNNPMGYIPTEASVAALTSDDLRAFYRQWYTPAAAVVTLVGDIDRAEAERIAQRLIGQLPSGGARTPLPAFVPVASTEQRVEHPTPQAQILLGQPSLARNDPDFFPLLVGNYVLGGGGFSSRLMHEVREKRGLVYGVSSSFNPQLLPGPFLISLTTQKGQADEALKIVRQVQKAFLEDGPTVKELQAAKDYLIGSFPSRINSNAAIAGVVGMIGYYGLPSDYLDTWTTKVRQVTAEQVRSAFARHVDPARQSLVVVGALGKEVQPVAPSANNDQNHEHDKDQHHDQTGSPQEAH